MGIGTNGPLMKLEVRTVERRQRLGPQVEQLSASGGWKCILLAWTSMRHGPSTRPTRSSSGDKPIPLSEAITRTLRIIWAKEVEVTLANFPDYVFDKEYRLMPLEEVAAYIQANGHLPNVPSACEVEENGLGLSGEMNKDPSGEGRRIDTACDQ
ncbi:MAG: hypothetical protein R2818_15965 [Flavobacteriales bacterium]